ncbi:hypothetical protein F5148DRAFT_1380554 [Russula earlei]|uniref:Uncharacterized protein n=1 Tax=Russula earlei TaxID=71964 RepID=A0ACC0TRI1_9AGAM|nr:hypothetical protein F5148DRAFT_1380554 [Russula earlei]
MRDYHHGFLPALITPVLLLGFMPSPKPRAAVPVKRHAETPAEQRSPGPNIVKPASQIASLALATAKKPIPQSTSPAPEASPLKPPSHEPPESGVIDLTQPTPELAPASPTQPPLMEARAQCAQEVSYFFENLRMYTQILPTSVCTVSQVLYEKVPERHASSSKALGPTYTNLQPIKLPGGTILPARSTGRLLGQDGEDFVTV